MQNETLRKLFQQAAEDIKRLELEPPESMAKVFSSEK